MSIVTTRAGTDLYFKDFGSGQPIVFVHGWPLNGDAWDGQMVFMQDNGFRVIAHDRRGHGRSSAHGDGNDMETYAADLKDLMDHLDLKDAVLVGHSTGGGEVAYYLGTYGSARVSKAVLLGAVPPLMLKTDDNPDGVPKDVFDGIWKSTFDDRSQFFLDFPEVFYGFNQPGAKRSEGLKHGFWLQGMMANQKSLLDCVAAFSATDFRQLLPKIDIPVLVAHGDADQVVPFAISAAKTSKLIPNATLKVYPGAPHGLASTLQDEFNADLLAFVKG